MKNNKSKKLIEECRIYHDSEHVSWTIPRHCIEETLLGKGNTTGLFFLNVESAGEIEFKDTSCKITSKNEKLCNKTVIDTLKYKNGTMDSVMTPLAVVNFHTHPLNCYIEAETIWGWPSGEDMAQCINFANDNNLSHVIFAIEGTYIIDVNNIILHYLQTNKKLFNIIQQNIQEIFKLTHKHRMLYNDSNKNISLEHEFNEIFLKPISLSSKKNIMYSWLNLVNNLTMEKLIIHSNEFNKYFPDIKKIKLGTVNQRYFDINIFSVKFFKNDTIQYNDNLSKQDLFKIMKKSKQNFKIILPEKIEYNAPFISEKCKL
jgi:hypothetical protein